MSNGEERIAKLLRHGGYRFIREYVLHDLRNGKYRLDFYLPDLKIAIEFEGAQHYRYVPKFFKTQSEFKKAQERSRQKMGYCLANGIKLYCIPFWEYNNLNSAADLFKDEFLVKNKFHDDIVWKNYQKSKKN